MVMERQELTRLIEDDLRTWARNKGKPALLKGARQTGKTHTIEKIGKQCFKSFIEYNRILDPERAAIFEGCHSKETFFQRLQASADAPLLPGETLVFIDEIQDYQDFDILTLIKALAIDGRYSYILSGSALGVAIQKTASYPVGYLTEFHLGPLNFEEYCLAKGFDRSLFESFRENIATRKPIDEPIHQLLLNYLYEYLVIGGMPEAVSSYVTDHSWTTVSGIQHDIVTGYSSDIVKYAANEDKVGIISSYANLASEIDKKNKRYNLNSLPLSRSGQRRLGDYVDWLNEAEIAIPIYNAVTPTIPLTRNHDRALLKLFANDVGLLSYMLSSTGTRTKLLKKEKSINYGAIFENFVAQELNKGKGGYYYNDKTRGEVDFLLEHNGEAIPIEVKSGKDYARHVALSNLLDSPDYGIKQSIVLSTANIEEKGSVLYLPVYLAGLLN